MNEHFNKHCPKRYYTMKYAYEHNTMSNHYVV